jgi:nucleotide-binding universal stress UspA family protein
MNHPDMGLSTYRIVVGVDGSDGSDRALRWAIREAAGRGGTVQAVIAWIWDGVDGAVIAKTHPAEERARAEQTLAEAVTAATTAHPGVAVAADAVEGPPGRVLTQAADGADLLVLGSHGHSRLYHAVLGSITQACIRAATCPVLVIPIPHDQRAPKRDEVQVGN